jgi:hypothetical protein
MSGRHACFRVRGWTFAYSLVGHRGNEGIEGLLCKVRPGENEALVERDPDRSSGPAYMDHLGWVRCASTPA